MYLDKVIGRKMGLVMQILPTLFLVIVNLRIMIAASAWILISMLVAERAVADKSFLIYCR